MSKLKFVSISSIVVLSFLSLIIIFPFNKEAKESTKVLFQDFEGDAVEVFVTNNVEGSITNEDSYEGEHSLKYVVQSSGDPSVDSGSIRFKSMNGPVDASESKYLIFYIKDTQGSNTLKVSITDSHGNSSGFNWKSPSTEKDKWVQYHIPMDSFNHVDQSSIEEIRIGQWNEGVYYIDHVFFTDSIPPAPPASPESYKPSGSYDEVVMVDLFSKSGILPIYYTTDGTKPDKDSNLYEKPLVITKDTIIHAVAYDPVNELYSSESVFEYIILNPKGIFEPNFIPSGGTYYKEKKVMLNTPDEGATIYYTLDGTKPSESSEKYTEPIHITEDTTIKAISIKDDYESDIVTNEYVISHKPSAFLKADGKVMRNNYGSGEQVTLRGTNVGGWLVMEEWMSPVNSPDQKTTIETLTERFGSETAWDLINVYQDHYWQESDFDLVKKEGMNVLRLPFTYFEMLNEDGSLKDTAFDRLDWFIEEAEKRELYVILDLHGAPGSQNGKDHSGDISHPNGGNMYGNVENMNKTVFLWEQVAKRYKDREWVAGYDVLNEPEGAHGKEQFEFYDRLYNAIRQIDPNHVIFFEAIWEPQDLPNPEVYQWENVSYSYHFYGWDDIDGYLYQKDFTDSKVHMVNKLTNYNVPLLVGEFTLFNNIQNWEYALKVYEEQQWSYTTWTFKVTGLNSSWGLFTGEPPKVDIYNDSEQTIREKWSKVGTDTSYVRNHYIADTLRNFSDPKARLNDERFLIADFENLKANYDFQTGSNAEALLDFEKKSAGEASVQLIVQNDTNLDEQFVTIFADENNALNLKDDSGSFPKYLVFDMFNGTDNFQRPYVTLIDKDGKKASTWTHGATQALPNAWSKIPLLLSTIEGDIDLTSIVEIRIAIEAKGIYHFDNIFVGQSFANVVPERVLEEDKTDPEKENNDEKDQDEEDESDLDIEAPDKDTPEIENQDDEEDVNGTETDDKDGQVVEDNEENKDDHEVIVPEGETDQGKELPNTATNLYNYLLIGALFIVLGGFVYYRYRKTA